MVSGQNIKSYLDRNGIKQAYLSEKTNIPANTLNAMLNGQRRIEVNEYINICSALNVPLDKFAQQEEPAGGR